MGFGGFWDFFSRIWIGKVENEEENEFGRFVKGEESSIFGASMVKMKKYWSWVFEPGGWVLEESGVFGVRLIRHGRRR